MIFDNDYDNSLWYIVKADKKNRKELVDFLKEIPEELFDIIRKAIKEINGGYLEDTNDPISFRYKCKNSDFYYDCNIDSFDMGINIEKGIDDGKMGKPLFYMILYPTNLEQLKEIEIGDEMWIGSISNVANCEYLADNMQQTDEIETEYNIRHLPIGYFVSCAKYSDKREYMYYKPISLKKIPNDLNRQNILQRKK